MSSSVYYTCIALFLIICAILLFRPYASCSRPNFYVRTNHPHHDLLLYVSCPKYLGWATRVRKYECKVDWMETDPYTTVRKFILRSTSKNAYHKLFSNPGKLCTSIYFGLGDSGTLPAGRYNLGLRAFNGFEWSEWRHRTCVINSPMSSSGAEDELKIRVYQTGNDDFTLDDHDLNDM